MTTQNESTWDIGRLLGACALAFLVLGSYSIARPAVESLFLDRYTSAGLPYVWLAVAFFVTLTVGVYNSFARRVNLPYLFGGCVAVTLGTLVSLLGLHLLGVAHMPFALYVWKDIYVVVMVELFWTYANNTFPTKQARWIYGLFCVMGTLGSMAGNSTIGYLANALGTEHTLWFVLPILGLSVPIFAMVARGEGPPAAQKEAVEKKSSVREGFDVMRKSPYLILMLLLIIVIQIAINLIDYQYSEILETTYPDKDTRTGIIGQVYFAIDIGALVLQFLSGPILALIGVSRTLLFIPIALGAAVGFFLASPRFITMAIAKVASKCFDYSIFRTAKELLYIPLSYAEKTQGKAIVDIMTYRVAKGTAALLLLGLGALPALLGLQTLPLLWISLITLALLIAWIAITFLIVSRYNKRNLAQSTEASAPADT